jgi:hypothetical protein
MDADRLDRLPVPARAVADAPVEALVQRADELAQSWALALLGARPLAQMVEVPLEDLARHAPALIASVARALRSDRELSQFAADPRAGARGAEDAGAVALDALSAGWAAAAAVAQVELMRQLLWRAALEELREATPRQVADLADRLGSVCTALLGHALAAKPEPARQAPRAGRAASEQVLYTAPGPAPGEAGAVLIDERDQDWQVTRPQGERRVQAQRTSAGGPGADREASAAASSQRRAAPSVPRPLPWDTPLGPAAAPSGADAVDPAAASEDPVMRASRGPAAPGDGSF